MTRPVSFLVVAALAVGLGCGRTAPCGSRQAPSRPGAGVVPLSAVFTPDQPFAFVLPALQPVQGVGGLRAEQCGQCHPEQHAEWARSTHAAALRDPQFQAELYKPTSPRWLCLNCHIPLQDQRREIVTGLRAGDVLRPVTAPNPRLDVGLQREAITCATCHVRRDAAGRSLVVGPRGNAKAPHPVVRDPQALRDGCLRCHDPRGERITPQLVCWFKTREELAKGPYAGKKGCVDCHLPRVRRRIAPSFEEFPERDSAQHHWVGGGVPKEFAAYDQLLARGWRPALEARLLQAQAAPGGRRVTFALEVENARAGHALPTGDPERFLLLQAELLDATGRRLARVTHHIGQVWRWEPRAEKVSDNRLGPKERRQWAGAVVAPAGAATPAQLVVTVYHVRLTTKTAAYMQTHSRTEETYVRGVRAKVRALAQHYPLASYLYQERVTLASGARQRLSLAELVALSKAEQRRPMAARDY